MTPSPLKLTLNLDQTPKSEILPKVGVKDEVSRKTSTGAMRAGLGMEGPQGWKFTPHIKV